MDVCSHIYIMAKGKKQKRSYSPLIIGHILLMANIGLNIFIKAQGSISWLKSIGFIILIPVVILWIIPVVTLRKYGSISPDGSFLATTQLVEKGIYRVVRHPQYLSFMLLNTGFALLNQDAITLVISFLSVLFLTLGIKEEEQLLTEQFGDDYVDYKKKVPSINILAGIYRIFFKQS